MSPERILVAMSGGVDSSVAAALLQRDGHAVVGVFMRGSLPPASADACRPRGCCSEVDAADVRRVADRLGIPFHVRDLNPGFEALKHYFAEAYHQGLTPNPCIQCNRTLKFGALLELADALGCRAVATGHYARREEADDGRVRLRRACDRAKDQSYVLLSLDREMLRRARFPLGAHTKTEVRRLAASFGLSIAEKPESQEVCFVPDDYRSFLRDRDPARIRSGRFVGLDGEDLGEHDGHQLFTIGQRKGLGIAFGKPMYVVAKIPERNEVVLGAREDLGATTVTVGRVGWISSDPIAAGERFPARVQVRHRHEPASSMVEVGTDGKLRVVFARAVFAVAPGQGAAIYQDDVLMAGGWIENAS